MRFLANENIPRLSIERLRAAGLEVAAVAEDTLGATDEQVLARAAQETRLILTFDRDYGELLYRQGLPAPAGVVYFRFDPMTPEEPAQFLLRILALEEVSLEAMFTVVQRDQIRQRPLP